MDEKISAGPSIWRHFRPTWRRSVLVLLCAIVSGIAGLYIRLLSECWSVNQDCAGYFPLGILVSDLMSWPIFVTERLAFGEHGFISNYDPVLARYWWILVPMLWLYDYTVFVGVKAVVAFIRSAGHRK